ncbi:MAG: hypothetical protein R2708_01945 [Vicinamibacterales bacterium]
MDYAGLFPPAGLPMADAVAEYRAALAGPSAWMLGRFVVPAARLEELARALEAGPGAVGVAASTAAATAGAGPAGATRWGISAIVRDGAADDLAAVTAFNAASARLGARVDSVESKPASLEGVDRLASSCAGLGEVYVEIAPGPEADAWLARVAARGLRAKVRTGGVTAEAFPSPAALAAFLAAAVRHGVAFKATAGLHHAVRGAYRLTYEPGAASAPMYGYLNVLLATAALRAGAPVETAAAVLQQSEAGDLAFDDAAVRWGGQTYAAADLAALRARGLVSFGSCSFREPAGEFAALAGRRHADDERAASQGGTRNAAPSTSTT